MSNFLPQSLCSHVYQGVMEEDPGESGDDSAPLPPGNLGPLPHSSSPQGAESWRDSDDDGSDGDSGDDDLLDELDEDKVHSLVCYVCFKKKQASSKQATVTSLHSCQDYRHPTKVHKACLDSLGEGGRSCIFCQPDILVLGDYGLCKLAVQMATRAAADRDIQYRACYELIRLTNISPEHVVKLHEFGASTVVIRALSAWPSDLPFCLRAIDTVIALCQLPPDRVTDSINIGDASIHMCNILRANLDDPEACIKALSALTRVAGLARRNIHMVEEAGACPLIVDAMRRHKEKHAVQMAGMEAIRALSHHNLREDSLTVQSKLPELFAETMQRYGKDRSIQLFCLENLGDVCLDATSAGILGQNNACHACKDALSHFKSDAEVQRAGCRLFTKLGAHHQGNRDKLLSLGAPALVTRAVCSHPKDRALLLEALRTTYCLSSGGATGNSTAAPLAAAFGEAGVCEAILAGMGTFVDVEVFAGSALALSAVVMCSEQNRARLAAASAITVLNNLSTRLAIKDKAVLQQVGLLINTIDPSYAAATASPALPSPVRRGSQPPPISQASPPPASPRTQHQQHQQHERRASSSSSSLPPIPTSRPTSPASTTGGPYARTTSVSPRSDHSTTASTIPFKDVIYGGAGSTSPRSLSSTMGSSVARTPHSTTSLPQLIAATPSNTITEHQMNAASLRHSQLQAGLERLAEAADLNLSSSLSIVRGSEAHIQQELGMGTGGNSGGGSGRSKGTDSRTSAEAAI